MTDLQKGIITMIRCAVTGQPGTLPEGFSMADAMETVRSHQIGTLIYQGALLCGIPKTTPEMRQLFALYVRCLAHSEGQLAAIRQLFVAFDDHGIDYLPLKGCNMKPLYPKPELRLMGDADILIRTSQYAAIEPVVQALGYTRQVESDHEYIWQSNRLHLELHKRLIPSYNKDYFAFFGDGWQLAAPRSGSRYAMAAEDEFVYNFTHFAKHYRDGGIGLRHVTDLWVFLRSYPAMDEARLQQALSTLGLQEFYGNIRSLIACWFEDGESTEKTEFIAEFLFSSGAWGEAETHKVSQIAKRGRIALTRSLLFPNRFIMEQKYPVLKKCPILLPIFWPVRWVTGLLLRRDNIRRQKELITEDASAIRSYEDALRYVGLSFDFKQ